MLAGNPSSERVSRGPQDEGPPACRQRALLSEFDSRYVACPPRPSLSSCSIENPSSAAAAGATAPARNDSATRADTMIFMIYLRRFVCFDRGFAPRGHEVGIVSKCERRDRACVIDSDWHPRFLAPVSEERLACAGHPTIPAACLRPPAGAQADPRRHSCSALPRVGALPTFRADAGGYPQFRALPGDRSWKRLV